MIPIDFRQFVAVWLIAWLSWPGVKEMLDLYEPFIMPKDRT